MHSLRTSVFNFATKNKHIIRPITANNFTHTVHSNQTEVKSWRDIPGPSPFVSFLQNCFQNSTARGIDDVDDSLYKQYGPIVMMKSIFGSSNIILLYDAEASSQILRSENIMPIRIGFQSLDYYRKEYNKISDNIYGMSGLLTDQGELWKRFRSTVNPILLQPKTIKLYKSSLNEVAEDMIKRMRLIRNDQNMLEGKFDEEMNLWALESIGVVALGGRLNCFDRNLPDDSPAKQLIQLTHDIFKVTDKIDYKPSLWRYVSTPLFRKAMKLYEKQIELSRFFIKKATEQLNAKDKTLSMDEKGVLEKLLEIDENIAVIMASDMLFAGVDTTSNTITATLYLLAKNPEKQNRLRKEILSQTEKRSYLKACIKESMRMFPVVSGNLRVTTKEYDILGYKIPKDMLVSFGHQSLSLMEEHFPKPKEFIPERWITDKTDPLYYRNAHPFAFSPFGFGARSCMGRRIAEIELEMLLSKIIKNFNVEWFGPPLKIKPGTLTYTVAPFNFVFKDV